jgi:hypothetical protein
MPVVTARNSPVERKAERAGPVLLAQEFLIADKKEPQTRTGETGVADRFRLNQTEES